MPITMTAASTPPATSGALADPVPGFEEALVFFRLFAFGRVRPVDPVFLDFGGERFINTGLLHWGQRTFFPACSSASFKVRPQEQLTEIVIRMTPAVGIESHHGTGDRDVVHFAIDSILKPLTTRK